MNSTTLIEAKDRSTVTAAGERKDKMIEGVVVRPSITHPDERGEICEMYSKAWGIEPQAELKHVYMASVRPGRVKGWVYHKVQSDRMFILSGYFKFVLWDIREDSPTYGMVNEIHIGERNRALLLIPPFVVHAVQNIGTEDAVFINMPTHPYNHENPDKYRVEKASVPYSFAREIGW